LSSWDSRMARASVRTSGKFSTFSAATASISSAPSRREMYLWTPLALSGCDVSDASAYPLKPHDDVRQQPPEGRRRRQISVGPRSELLHRSIELVPRFVKVDVSDVLPG
jgi:hypothetical protein